MASLVKIDQRLASVELILAKQNAHLEDHLRRTGKLEKSVEHVETHVKRVQGAAKIISLLLTLAASVWGLIKFH